MSQISPPAAQILQSRPPVPQLSLFSPPSTASPSSTTSSASNSNSSSSSFTNNNPASTTHAKSDAQIPAVVNSHATLPPQHSSSHSSMSRHHSSSVSPPLSLSGSISSKSASSPLVADSPIQINHRTTNNSQQPLRSAINNVSSASPPLVPRIRLPTPHLSPPMSHRHISAPPTLSQASPANHTPSIPNTASSSDKAPSSASDAPTPSSSVTPSRHSRHHQSSSSRPQKPGSRGNSSSRPGSRNENHPNRSTPSSRPISRPGSSHSSRAHSRRQSFDASALAAPPLFVAGGDLLVQSQDGIDSTMDESNLMDKDDSRMNDHHADDEEDDVEDEEESNTEMLVGGTTGLDVTMNEEDEDEETLDSLRTIPHKHSRNLSVNTQDDTGSALPSAAPTPQATFRVPSLSLTLPTPTGAGGVSFSPCTSNITTPAGAAVPGLGRIPPLSSAPPSARGLMRSKFSDLKLVCPSPDHNPGSVSHKGIGGMNSNNNKEDKLLYFSRICSVLSDNLCVGSRTIASDWRQIEANGITHIINCAGDICENSFEYFPPKTNDTPPNQGINGSDSHKNGKSFNSNGGSKSHQLAAANARSLAAQDDISPLSATIQTRPIQYLRLFLLDSQDEDLMCVLYPVIEFVQSAIAAGSVSHTPQSIAALMGLQAAGNKDPNTTSTPAASTIAVSSSLAPRVLIHCQQGVSRSTALCIAFLMLDRGWEYEEAYAHVRAIRGITRPNFGFIAQLKAWKQRMNGWEKAHTHAKSKRGKRSSATSSPQRDYLPPILYRVTPHCTRDRRIVLKIVDSLSPSNMDSRTIFLLVTRDMCYIWIGSLVVPEQEKAYMPQIAKQLQRLRKYEHAPDRDIILRQADEQSFLKAMQASGACSESNPFYVIQELSVPNSNHHSDDEEEYTRSASQTQFLSTLMSPNTLKSLNVIPSPAGSCRNSSHSSTTSSIAPSPAMTPHHNYPLIHFATNSPSVRPSTLPSVAASPAGASQPILFTSAPCLTPSLKHLASAISPSQPSWSDCSKSFWSVLNGTPEHELICRDYEEDYPTHEWMALHLALTNHQTNANARTQQFAWSGSGMPDTRNGTQDHDEMDYDTTTSLMRTSMEHSSTSSASIHAAKPSIPSPASAANITQKHMFMKNGNADDVSHHRLPPKRRASIGNNQQSETTSPLLKHTSPVAARGSMPVETLLAKRNWLTKRWNHGDLSYQTANKEAAIMTPLLQDASSQIHTAIIADNVEFVHKYLADNSSADTKTMWKQAAMCGSQHVTEHLMQQLNLDFLSDGCLLLALAAASNNMSWTLSVAKSTAESGGKIPEDVYRLAENFHVVDSITDMFHQYATSPSWRNMKSSEGNPHHDDEMSDHCDILSTPEVNDSAMKKRNGRGRSYDGGDEDEGELLLENIGERFPQPSFQKSTWMDTAADGTSSSVGFNSPPTRLSSHTNSRTNKNTILDIPLNPLQIGLGDAVPIGFVANSGWFPYSNDDSDDSEEEELLMEHSKHHRHPSRANPHAHNSNGSAGSAPASVSAPPLAVDTFAGAPSPKKRRSSTDSHQPAEDDVLKPEEEDEDEDEAAEAVEHEDASVETRLKHHRAYLYSYPDWEELTSFDIDDLVHTATLLLVWRPRSGDDILADEDQTSEDDHEIAEVRNVRLRKAKMAGLHSSTHKKRKQRLQKATVDRSQLPVHYHVWFGSDSSPPEDKQVAAEAVVNEFLQQHSEADNQQKEDGHSVRSIISIEEDGEESEEFLFAFEQL